MYSTQSGGVRERRWALPCGTWPAVGTGLLAVAVVVWLTVVPVPDSGLRDTRGEASTRIMLTNICQGLRLFHLDSGMYPTLQEGLTILWQYSGAPGWKGPYLVLGDKARQGIVDFWGNGVGYVPDDGGPLVQSRGPDGVMGPQTTLW